MPIMPGGHPECGRVLLDVETIAKIRFHVGTAHHRSMNCNVTGPRRFRRAFRTAGSRDLGELALAGGLLKLRARTVQLAQ